MTPSESRGGAGRKCSPPISSAAGNRRRPAVWCKVHYVKCIVAHDSHDSDGRQSSEAAWCVVVHCTASRRIVYRNASRRVWLCCVVACCVVLCCGRCGVFHMTNWEAGLPQAAMPALRTTI